MGITRVTGMTAPLLDDQAAGRAAVFACRRCRNSRRVPTSSCCPRSTGSSQPRNPSRLQKLDPLTRGALFHEVQAEFFRELAARRTTAGLARRSRRARSRRSTRHGARRGRRPRPARAGDRARVARRDCRHREGPARVGAPARRAASEWLPEYFEFSFGLRDAEGRDPRSRPDPVARRRPLSVCAARSI